jgi:DNA-binding NarL/FixJ family response regulator
LVIRTRHPLVACLIEMVLQTDRQMLQFVVLAPNFSRLPTHPETIVIIDAFSIRLWRQQLSMCQEQNCRSIVLMMPNPHKDVDVLEALSLGARGIIDMRRSQREDLHTAIRKVMEGQVWSSPTLSQCCGRHLSQLRKQMASLSETLTAREQDVMGMVTKGLGNKQIAGALNISARTVKFHVSNILRKGQVNNRHDLIILKQP